MTYQIQFFRALVLCFVLSLAFSGTSLCEESSTPPPAFVDRDGDGFNDNAVDGNNNGIPDTYDGTANTSAPQGRVTTPGLFASMNSASTGEQDLTISEHFNLRLFHARAIRDCRSNFEKAFDSNAGPSASGGSGGGCVGGICF